MMRQGSLGTQFLASLIVALPWVSGSALASEEKPQSTPEFTESSTIDVNALAGGSPLQCFAINPQGMILAGAGGHSAQGGLFGAVKKTPGGKIITIDPALGQVTKSWTLDFAPEAMCCTPEGQIYVLGEGQATILDENGEVQHRGIAPHAATALGGESKLRQMAEEQIKQDRKMWIGQIRDATASIVKYQGRDNASLEPSEILEMKNASATIEAIESYLTENSPTVEGTMAQMRVTRVGVSSVSVSGDHVFLAVPTTKGYGYDVWKCGADFSEPETIITGLKGCCGQMEVRVDGDRLFVAENSRHRVSCYDLDGNVEYHFGKRASRGSDEGFGSCCNPMNLAFTENGDIFAAEAEGNIKFFTRQGEEKGISAKSKLPSGCKNVSIRTSPSCNHLYLIDIYRGKIVVFDETQAASAY